MPLTPGYGETPLPHEELSALLADVIDLFDEPITRADVYDLEQGLQNKTSGELMPAAIDGSLSLDELLSDSFVRDLHTRLYGRVGLGRTMASDRGQHQCRARADRRRTTVIRARRTRPDPFADTVVADGPHASAPLKRRTDTCAG